MATSTKTINPSTVPITNLLARKDRGEKSRKKHDANWDRNFADYNSDQWKDIPKIAWFQSEPVYNKTFEFVETMRSLLADQKWGIDAVPTAMKIAGGKDPREMADKANKLLDWLWDELSLQTKLSEMFIHLFLKGTGILKASFDPNDISDAAIGQIQVDVVDPKYLYVDPDATCVEDAAWMIEAKPVSLHYIGLRWPEKLAEIKAKGGGSSFELAPQGSELSRVSSAEEGDRIDLLECWYADNEIILLEEDESTEKVGAKYPNGRYTLMTSNGVVLEDKPNPYERFPYIRFVEIPMPGSFWGGCTVDKASGIQRTINQLLRTIIDNGLWLVHGIWFADSNSGVSAKELSTYGPRDVVVKNPGTDVHRDGGDQLPQHLFETLNQQIEAYDRVVSLPDVLRGIVGSRQPVATVAQQQEAAELRTRERGRRIEQGLTDLGEFLFELVRNHWADTRTLARAKFTGGFEIFELSKEDFEGWQGKVRVRPGSTQPVDRASSLARCADLQNNFGVQIPPGFLISLADIPGLEAAMAEDSQDMASIDAGDEPPPDETEGIPPEDPMDLPPEGDMPIPPVDPSGAMGLPIPPLM